MNVGDMVYVRWYGKVVEGKLLEGEYLEMKQVQIPLDGRKVIALFTPQHIYRTAGATMEVGPSALFLPIRERVIPSTDTPSGDFFYEQIQEFKESHWDHEHNHLMIESLDEFYEIWKRESRIIKIVPKFTDADIEKLAEEFANYDGKIYVADAEPTILLESNKEPVPQNDTPSDKPKKSNPTITQLSLFD